MVDLEKEIELFINYVISKIEGGKAKTTYSYKASCELRESAYLLIAFKLGDIQKTYLIEDEYIEYDIDFDNNEIHFSIEREGNFEYHSEEVPYG